MNVLKGWIEEKYWCGENRFNRILNWKGLYSIKHTLSYTHAHHTACCVRCTREISILPLPFSLPHTHTHTHKSFMNSVTCCPILLHPHHHFPLSRLLCVLLPLLDLLFSLVRVRLMPLSMLIVHCSKAAFITMIKHSQTTAKYLKASGHGTWQVTTTRTNSSHFQSSQSPQLLERGLHPIASCRLMSHGTLMRN